MRLPLAMIVLAALAQPVHAADDIYNIMKPEPGARTATPEPWLAPKYQSPRGTIQRPVTGLSDSQASFCAAVSTTA